MFQNFPCIKVPLCPRVKVPLYTCTMYRSVKAVPSYPCIKVPLYPCIKVPLYPCIKVPLYPCISVPMCRVLCPTARQLLPKQSRQRFIVTYPCGQSTHTLTIPYSIAVPVHHGTNVSCPVPDSPSVAAQAEPAAVHRDVRAERRPVLPQHAERGASVPQPARLRDLLLGHLRLERLHPAAHRARLWRRSASQE